ncbi:MAG: phosphate propanoyltransferase [Candidatus Moraniibacteriota bacterium]
MEQKEIMVPVEVSARHIHLSPADREILFGKDYKLKPLKKLSQGEDFAAEETVDMEYNEHEIKGIRVVGPERPKTQLELTLADSYKLKADIPVRLSGDVDKTPGFRIIGPAGVAVTKEGLIVAKRHLHLSPEDAEKYGIKNEDLVSVTCGEQRKVAFHNVAVRVMKGFKLTMHIDVDEANAAGLKVCGVGKLIV